MKGRPLPFEEKDFKRFWKSEPWDDLVPKGFISDFVLALRGIETPTKFALWSALFILSSALKRDSWVSWHPFQIYPNLFVIIVGPPRVVAKTTAVNFGEGKVLSKFHTSMSSEYLSKLKRVKILRKSSPEALSIALTPEEEIFLDPDTKVVGNIDRGSQVCLIISELATFLGKQKYNTGLIDRLTHLYDSKDEDDELTISRGHLKFRNTYVTLFGATTKDGLEGSIPPEAFGSGFMSRLIIVYSPVPTRSHPIPQNVLPLEGGEFDWPKELQLRLAWVAEKSLGEFILSPEAEEAYISWYGGFRKLLTRKQDEKNISMKTRYDVHLLKLMLLLRAQNYDHVIGSPESRILTLEDFNFAQKILDHTYQDNFFSIEGAVSGKTEKWRSRVVKLIQDAGEITRKQLLPKMSPYQCYAGEVRSIVQQLADEGKIEILSELRIPRMIATDKGGEIYRWKGKEVRIDGLSKSDSEGFTETNEGDISTDGFTVGNEQDT